MWRHVALTAVLIAAFAGAGSAAAASAPTASTGPVTSVGPTTATVSGSVNPNGTATTWYAEYGTTTGYGSRTSSTSAGSGTSSVAVSPSFTGLKPGTSYHYRVVAVSSSAGTARGADGLLTTSSMPQAVTGAATSVTPSSAVLNGSVNPSSRATTWYFEYGTSTGYGAKTAAKDAGSGTSTVPVSAQLSGLASGRAYHFRLVATSDAGTSHGADQSFLASAPPTVSTRGASSIKGTTATLNASVNPNGQSTTVYFDYGGSTNYGAKSSAKNIGSGGSARSVAIGVAGLAPGTTYHVRVVASNSVGTNSGADVTFTTSGRPTARSGPAANVSSSAATLTGSVDANGYSTNWYFQYGATSSYGLLTPTHNAGSSPGSHSVSEAIGGLTAGRTYHYRLVATNSVGTSYGADTTLTTAGPPVTVAASAAVVVMRGPVRLSGHVATGRANETVMVFAQRFASDSFTSVATVLTDAAGSWSLTVKPPVRTTYKSVWSGQASSTVTVDVRPAVSLRELPRLRFTTHVTGVRSFAGRIVQLQRHLLNGSWVTVARARLNRSSNATFQPKLRRGRSTLRVAIDARQAGSGYRTGFSRWVSIRRH